MSATAYRLPLGFRAAGVYCGIKQDTSKLDLALLVSDRDAVAAGVYTQNQVFAAPVALDRQRTPGTSLRGVVINSGNANACTGARGDDDARHMAALAAAACDAGAEQMLVLSTGIIGEFLPMDRVAAGIVQTAERLGSDADSLVAAARGMLTTDTRHKLALREITVGGQTVTLCGLAKGAAMIGPNMATMLGVVLTDAALTPLVAQQALATAVDESFNCISVDGHMSTNDTVLLLANGAAVAEPLSGDALDEFQQALRSLCQELARAIPEDGEGATHLITIDVRGCASRADARLIAKSIAESPLVKTAVAGADPNWGRIVSAAGYAPVKFDPSRVDLWLNDMQLYAQGAPLKADDEAVSASIRANRETSIVLQLGEGNELIRFWTTDLTEEYVRLNADYHT